MKKVQFLMSILTILLLLISCNKEVPSGVIAEPETEFQKIPDGVYVGEFTVHYINISINAPVTLEINGGKYNCSGNTNRIPAGGSGTFTNTKEEITFMENHAWSCDFDMNLILSGKYNYTFDGSKLRISVENTIGQYEYTLEKVITAPNTR